MDGPLRRLADTRLAVGTLTRASSERRTVTTTNAANLVDVAAAEVRLKRLLSVEGVTGKKAKIAADDRERLSGIFLARYVERQSGVCAKLVETADAEQLVRLERGDGPVKVS